VDYRFELWPFLVDLRYAIQDVTTADEDDA